MRTMMRTIALTISIILLLSASAHAINLGKVVAYPVPFNPKNNLLKLMDKSASPDTITSLIFEVFDVNGDLVISKKYGDLNDIAWNGRNGSGVKVKPGLYIIKLTAEDSATGDYAKAIIRILVDY